ncbi:Ig-like domain-containing protein [Desulfosporosinus sp. PR]|uniref:Ig-like domain-containing protein n=1 Tax=Candidatus Desulfosporosinus nitrosoreducens TaxID=3401928 RepID=UPI0027E9C58A|nr:Ig-like domain-containing protein [Desulfosporosinus sp. PR]MDQ7093938.1 Ig-like domain-containing protein [Desulfosporosinus sp. PR]
MTTTVGTAPVLPATVTATMSDGSTKEVAVTWDSIDASSYAATGSFTISGAIADSTTVKATATVTVEEAQLSISNAAAILADSAAGNLKADGKTVVTVQATYKDAEAQGFTGTAELVSKHGLVSAQTEAAFDKGVATFNVTLPNSTTDIQDVLSVRIKTSNIPAEVNVVSSPISVTYKAYVPDGGASENTIKTYTVDAVKSADLADRVNVYVGNVANSDLDAVKQAIIDQLTLDNGPLATTPEPITIATIDTATVVGTPTSSTSASYVFSALIDLKNGADYLYDNQLINYTINAGTASIRLGQATGSFSLIDKTQPVMSSVTAPDADNPNRIVVTFSEPINTEPAAAVNAANSALNPTNWVLNGHVLLTSDLVAKGITVEPGNARNAVDINLTNSAIQKYLVDGENLIQAKSISDWAGLTDLTDNNKISTQDFTFNYSKPVVTPGLNITLGSAEQYELSLATPLYTDKDATTELDLTTEPLKVQLIDTSSKAQILDLTGDYSIVKDPADTSKYVLELTKDWTQLLTIPATYHNQTLKVSLGTAYDVYGNQVSGALDAAATELQPLSGTAVIPEDTTSPATTSKKILDLVDSASQNTDGNVTTTGNVSVTMTEPVQLYSVLPGYTQQVMYDDVTPSLQQVANGGVPVPTFEYVKVANDASITSAVPVGQKIDGHIVGTKAGESDSVNIYDTQFTVAPNSALEAGEWQLVIRSISDDIGNTMVTETVNLVIPATGVVTPVQTGDNQINPYVVWAYAENNVTDGNGNANDYVKILYSRQMSVDALRSATYDINGKQVNQDASITAESVVLYRQNEDPNNVNYNKFYGENNNMMNWTGELVTIKLPSDFITGDDLTGTAHNMLTLPANLMARDDGNATTSENLLFTNNNGSNQFELTFNTDRSKLPANALLPAFDKNQQYNSVDSYRNGTVTADLTAYNAALAAVNQADYTADSWTAYQAVVAANIVTTANTQTEVDTATANIKAAQKDLQPATGALQIVGTPSFNAVLQTLKVTVNDETLVKDVLVNGVSTKVTPLDNVFTVPVDDTTDRVVFVDADGNQVVVQEGTVATLTVTAAPTFDGLLGFEKIPVSDSSLVKTVIVNGTSYTVGAPAGDDGISVSAPNSTNIAVTGLTAAPTTIVLVDNSGAQVTAK